MIPCRTTDWLDVRRFAAAFQPAILNRSSSSTTSNVEDRRVASDSAQVIATENATVYFQPPEVAIAALEENARVSARSADLARQVLDVNRATVDRTLAAVESIDRGPGEETIRQVAGVGLLAIVGLVFFFSFGKK